MRCFILGIDRLGLIISIASLVLGSEIVLVGLRGHRGHLAHFYGTHILLTGSRTLLPSTTPWALPYLDRVNVGLALLGVFAGRLSLGIFVRL